jgi:glycosyltransferase involved in cell wall biosynthesis
VRQVLLIANPLRRADDSGAPRQPERWRDYLPDFGWEPAVLTAEQPPPTRTRHEVVRGFFVPDSYVVRWLPKALLDGRKLLRERRFDAILSTSPLDTCHLVALALRRSAELPWQADFRDLWIGNPFAPPRPRWADALNRRLERRVVRTADLVTCVSEQHRAELTERYPGVQLEVLENGYDPADLEGLEPIRNGAGELTLVHTGSFYGLRTPEILLDALQHLPAEFCLYLVGGSTETVDRMVEDRRLNGRVVTTKPVPHREALAHGLGADVLVIVPGDEAALPGKLYEYAAMGKPVLHVGPAESATGRRVAEWGIGRSAETPEEIAAAVQALKPVEKPAGLAAYDRRAITAQLAGLLDRLCES